MLPTVILVILSAAKDLTERPGAGGVAGVRSFAALRTTEERLRAKRSEGAAMTDEIGLEGGPAIDACAMVG